MNKSIRFIVIPNEIKSDKIREKTLNFFESQGLAKKLAHEQVNILIGLMENCLYYSGCISPKDKMSISIFISEDSITTEVSNPIKSLENNKLNKLDKTIQFIRGYQDPFEAYMLLQSEYNEGSSELALAKLACESRSLIDFFVSADNIISMSAFRKLNNQVKIKNL